MRNYIWINYTRDKVLGQLDREGAYAVFVRWNDPTIRDIRNFIKQSMASASVADLSRVMVLDATDMSSKRFMLFLKMLEQPGNLYLSFIGARLNHYPLTVISRCQVRMRSVKENMTEILSKLELMHYFDEVQSLSHYDVDTAVRMVDSKPFFVDMLVRLEDFKADKYSSIGSFQKQPVEFIYLFYEWLNRNPLFTTVDLDRCSFLRDEEMIRLLQEVSNCDPKFEQYLIDLLFVRKATMNAY